MTLETPVWLEAVSGDTAITFSARQYRTLIDAIWSAEGVVNPSDLAVTQRAAGANMSVDVAAGLVVIQGGSTSGQGKYVMRNTATVNLTINTAPTSGSRTDLVVAQVYDKQSDGGSTYGWTINVLPGTTTVPVSASELARITVPSGTSSITTANIVTTSRQYATSTDRPANPIYTIMASSPNFNSGSLNTVYDFTSAQWAPLTFTMPPSGRAYVTVTADLSTQPSTQNSYVEVTWSVEVGSSTIVGTGRSVAGYGAKSNGSRRVLLTGPPGESTRLRPGWRAGGYMSNEWTTIAYAVLLVEPV